MIIMIRIGFERLLKYSIKNVGNTIDNYSGSKMSPVTLNPTGPSKNPCRSLMTDIYAGVYTSLRI